MKNIAQNDTMTTDYRYSYGNIHDQQEPNVYGLINKCWRGDMTPKSGD